MGMALEGGKGVEFDAGGGGGGGGVGGAKYLKEGGLRRCAESYI